MIAITENKVIYCSGVYTWLACQSVSQLGTFNEHITASASLRESHEAFAKTIV